MIQNKNAYKYILKSCFIIRLILLIYANANLTLINFKIIIKKSTRQKIIKFFIEKKYRFHFQIKKNKSYEKKYLYLDVGVRKLILKDRNSAQKNYSIIPRKIS